MVTSTFKFFIYIICGIDKSIWECRAHIKIILHLKNVIFLLLDIRSYDTIK